MIYETHTLYAHPMNYVKNILYAQLIWWIVLNMLYTRHVRYNLLNTLFLVFPLIQILRKQRNVHEIPVSMYCVSMLQKNAVRLWPEDQYIPRNVGNCQLTRSISWKAAVWIVTAVKTSNLNTEMLYVHYFFKFAVFNTKQRESRKRIILNDLQQVRGLFVMCKCQQHNSFIQEIVLK